MVALICGAKTALAENYIVKAGDNCAGAIGGGHNQSDNNTLSFSGNMCVYITNNLYRSIKANRVGDCRGNKYVKICECVHEEATASIVNADKHNVSECKWCYTTGEKSHTFCDYGQCPACHLISLSDKASNRETISHWAEDNGLHDVVLSGRKIFKDDSWNTLCLPFDIVLEGSPLEGATVKTLSSTSFDNGTLTMNFSDNLTSIEAGTPYLVKWETPQTEVADPIFQRVTFDNTMKNVETEYVDFVGSSSPVEIEGEDRSMFYLGDANNLYYPNAPMTLGSCRAYFQLKGITAGDPTSGVREFVMNFENSETTGLSPIVNSPFSIPHSEWYDLQGRRVANGLKPTAKGLYIYNGHKTVIK